MSPLLSINARTTVRPRVCFPLLLVCLAALLCASPAVAASPAVTTASCVVDAAGACLNTTVTFSGTDLGDVTAVRIGLTAADEVLLTCRDVKASATAVTCTLTTAAAASAGLYPATLLLSSGAQVEAGSLLLGNTYEQEAIPRWTSTTNSSAYRVTGQSSDWPSTGDTWSVSGTFDPAATYTVAFYNAQKKAAATSPGTPVCVPTTVTATTLTCTITSANGVMGMYNFLVKDTTHNALLLGSASLYKLAVNPPLPEVTGATGACATSSASCVSGAALHIVGTNFNYRSAAYQQFFVGVTSAQRSAIQLTPTAVDATGIDLALTVDDAIPAGTYPVYVKVQVCMMGMMSPLYYVGNLVVGSGSAAAGFEVSNAAAIGTVVVSGFCYDGDDLCRNATVTLTGTQLAGVTAVHVGATAAEQALLPCPVVGTPTERTVACSLTAAAAAADGIYPVTLVLSSGTQVEAGSLAVGTFLEARGVAGWTNTSASSAYRVTAQSSDWPSTGDTWSVSGTFDPAATYTVAFYNAQKKAAATSPGTPVCVPTTVTATTLTCTITSANGVMGMYNFLVKDTTHNALLLGSASLYKLAVNPPLPEVTGATGACATSSASCVSGAALHIVGTNFNYRSAAYQQFFVGVTSAQRSAIQLTPTAVDATGIDLALTVDDAIPAGTYPVYVKVQVCMMGMMSPLYYVGNLVVGSGSAAAGFEVSNAAAIGTVVVSGFCYDGDDLCRNATVTLTGTQLAGVTAVHVGATAAEQALLPCPVVGTPTERTVACSLTAAAAAADGIYPVTLVLSSGTQVEAGSLAVGTFLEARGVAGWTNTSASSAYRVTAQSSDWPSTGDTWSVSGTFDPAATYTVAFYNAQKKAAATSPGTPVCVPTTVTATTLTCTITSANGVMGMYNFLVKDTTHNALLLGSASLYKLAVNPPLPEVTGATGACATSSASCVSGAALHIVGTNFNYRSAAYQQFFVGVTSAQRSAIQLTPTAVDATGIDLALTVDDAIPAGTYPVYVKVQVCMMGMMSPLYYVGNLVVGSGSAAAGFEVSNAAAIGTVVVSGFCYDGDDLCRNATVTLTGTQLAGVTAVHVGATAAEQALLPCPVVGTPTERTVACSLTAAAAAADGIYPVTLVLSSGTQVEAGSLAVGTFLEARGVAGWTNTSASSAYRVTAQSSDWPSTGDTWSVSGTFDPAATYNVTFFNDEEDAAATSPGTPVCVPTTVTATTLTCTITSANGVMGMYNFLVKDTTRNALLLGSASLDMLAVNPPLPEVTGATGACATSSASCVSGAALHIVGTNFNYRSAAYQQFFVGVTSAQRSAIQLTPTAVDTTGIDVTLTTGGTLRAGSYPIFVKVQVCMMPMMSPLRYVGNLVLRDPNLATPGFNLEMPNGGGTGDGVVVPNRWSSGYIAAVVCACVFGVLCLVALLVLAAYVVRHRRRMLRWARREEYLASQAYNNASGDFPMPKMEGLNTPYGNN